MDDPVRPLHPHPAPAEVTRQPTASELVYLFAERCGVKTTIHPALRISSSLVLNCIGVLSIATLVLLLTVSPSMPGLIFLGLLLLLLPVLWNALNAKSLPTLHIGAWHGLDATAAPTPDVRTTEHWDNLNNAQESFAAALFAVGFWSLHQDERIVLEVSEETRLFGGRTRAVRVRHVSASDARTSTACRLERAIMANLPEHLAIRGKDIIHSCLRASWKYRCSEVVEMVMKDVNDLGGARIQRGAWELRPAGEAAFNDVVARWRAFQTTEPALAQALFHECLAAFPPYDPISS